MKKQPTLFDVPKDSPSRRDRTEAFKAAHGIWTHDAKWKGEFRWCALLLKNPFCPDGSIEPIEQIAEYCSVLDEGGFLVSENTERAAIMELCRLNNIPCDL